MTIPAELLTPEVITALGGPGVLLLILWQAMRRAPPPPSTVRDVHADLLALSDRIALLAERLARIEGTLSKRD